MLHETDPEQQQSTKVTRPKKSPDADTWPETAVREQEISPPLQKIKKEEK